MDYSELITRLETMCACAPRDAVRVMSDAVSALEAQGRRLAEAEALLRRWRSDAPHGKIVWNLVADTDAFLTPPPAPGSTPAAD